MNVDITPPSDAELNELLALHQARAAEPCTLTVVGDGGREVLLPFVLGLPSGVCAGGEPSAARVWQSAVAVALRGRDDATINALLVDDCILWPSAGEKRTAWLERWPAIVGPLGSLVAYKAGATPGVISAPAGEPPAAVKAARAQWPRAWWRRLSPPGGEHFDVLIDPPDRGLWRMFKDGVDKVDDVWKLTRETAEACVRYSARTDGTPEPFMNLVDRWPGLAINTVGVVRHLAGVFAEARLGKW